MSGPLAPGDRVVVVSPSSASPADEVDAGVALLRGWGLDAVAAPHAKDYHPGLRYLAGTDPDRAADLTAALVDPGVRGVLCARGGYGSQRMVDLVDWPSVAAAEPSVFVGSSDATALHERFSAFGLPSWFGPMVATPAFLSDAVARENLRRALFEGVRSYSGAPVVGGRASGVAFGGNLSLLGPPPPDGAVVLIEEVGEEPYRLDRMLTALRRSGWFGGVAAVVLGSWDGCGDRSVVDEVLADRLGTLGVPVIGDAGFGHCPEQVTVPLGVPVEVDADAGVVTVLDPAGSGGPRPLLDVAS
ncbi:MULTISPECIES: LD-carboxypeptidase [Actinosynnema]|uniref:S66 peptidase family protein n=1 Tax=Actinosynnema TaxID=40566 RepID=UPI0020A4C6B6|nr:LD-carboxypeptidase [Actinosynnema pretiosum]MCP2096188.1 muramoyltetrapeptide carboxypeptidase [Actinosynnema pretiosum]